MDYDSLFVLLSVPVESVQLSSLGFVPEVGWRPDALDVVEGISLLRLNVSGPGYLALFLLLTVLLLCFLLYGLVSLMLGGGAGEALECCPQAVDALTWQAGQQMVFGVLFVPMLSLVLQVFNCEDGHLAEADDVECWKGAHVGYVLLGVVALVVFLPGAILKALLTDAESHSKEKKASYKARYRFVDSKYLLIRVLLVALAIGLTQSEVGTRRGCAVCMVVLSFFPFAFFWYYQPHREPKFNYAKCAFFGGTFWSMICTAVVATAEENDTDQQNTGGWMLIGYPIMVLFGLFACWARNQCLPKAAFKPREWHQESIEGVRLSSKPFHESPLLQRMRRAKKEQVESEKEDKKSEAAGDATALALPTEDTGTGAALGADEEKGNGSGTMEVAAATDSNDTTLQRQTSGGKIVALLDLNKIREAANKPKPKGEDDVEPEERDPVTLTAQVATEENLEMLIELLKTPPDPTLPPVKELVIEPAYSSALANIKARQAAQLLLRLLEPADNATMAQVEVIKINNFGGLKQQETLDIVEAVQRLEHVSGLELYGDGIKDATAKQIGEALVPLPQFNYIGLSGNAITATMQAHLENLAASREDLIMEAVA